MRYFQLCGLFPLFLFLFCFSFCMFVCLFVFICQSRADGGPFDIIPYIVRCALDIICSKLPSLNNRSEMRIPTLRRWTFIYESLNHHFNENLQLCCLHFTFIFWTFFFLFQLRLWTPHPIHRSMQNLHILMQSLGMRNIHSMFMNVYGCWRLKFVL